MKRRSLKQHLFWFGAFLVCAALVKPMQDRIEARREDPGEPDILFFSSPSVVKRMALSYDSLVADLYWMRTIQYYGRRDEADKRPVRYKNLAKLLDITTTLDPGLLDAYRTGSSFLAEPDPIGAGQPEEALKLLDKGIREHPQEWRLRHDKGFIYYWHLKDYKAAGDIWNEASNLPGAPMWLSPLAAMSLSKGGAIEVAIALWRYQYEESDRETVKENARNHLLSIEVARDIWSLDRLTEKYKEKTGAYPRSLEEAVRGRKGYRIVDPLGTPYMYNPATGAASLSPDSTVRYLHVPEIYRESLAIEPQ